MFLKLGVPETFQMNKKTKSCLITQAPGSRVISPLMQRNALLIAVAAFGLPSAPYMKKNHEEKKLAVPIAPKLFIQQELFCYEKKRFRTTYFCAHHPAR